MNVENIVPGDKTPFTITLSSSLTKHEDKVWCLSWHPTEDLFASSGSDKKIIIWGGSSGSSESSEKSGYKAKAILDESHSRTIRSITWDNFGNFLASASFDSTINIWKKKLNASNLEFECIASLEGHENEVKSVSWSASGLYLASCSRDKTIWIWDIDEESDFSCNNVLQGHTQDIKMIKWSPKEDVLFSCSYDDLIKVWQYEESQDDWTCVNTLNGHSSTVWALDISKCGTYIISGSEDNSICLWKIEDYNYRSIKMICKVIDAHQRSILSLAFNFDDSLIITGSSDNSIALWNVDYTSNKVSLISKVEDAHDEDVNCVIWKSDKSASKRNIAVSCSDDEVIKIWEIDTQTNNK